MNKQITNEGVRITDIEYLTLHTIIRLPLSKMISEHKIKSVSDALLVPEIWDINNGRCLCRKCHKETKTWGVNANKKIRNDKQ